MDKMLYSAASNAKKGILIEGAGADEAAREAARIVLCVNGRGGECACGACRAFLAGTNPDFTVLEKEPGKTVIGIDLMRDTLNGQSMVPVVSRKKVVLIPDFGSASPEAQNAVLKNLEDDEGVCVIATFATGTVLPTIRSRMSCVRLAGETENPIKEDLKEKIAAAFNAGNGRELMQALSIFREKDKADFFAVSGREGARQIADLFIRLEYDLINSGKINNEGAWDFVLRCGAEQASMNISYGKLQFYAFIAYVAEYIERRKQ